MTREEAQDKLVMAGVPANFFEVIAHRALSNDGDWCVKWWGTKRVGIRFSVCDGFHLQIDDEASIVQSCTGD